MFGFPLQDGMTSLTLASQEGHLDTVEVLLQHNANVNGQTKVTDIELPTK